MAEKTSIGGTIINGVETIRIKKGDTITVLRIQADRANDRPE